MTDFLGNIGVLTPLKSICNSKSGYSTFERKGQNGIECICTCARCFVKSNLIMISIDSTMKDFFERNQGYISGKS